MTTARPHIVFVHGAWHGGWSWGTAPQRLDELGYGISVVDQLPSTRGVPSAGLREDADAVRALIASAPGPVVLAAHSYGGMVASELAGDPKVAAVVYVAAFVPRAGVTLLDLLGGRLPSWVQEHERTGLCVVDPAMAIQLMASNTLTGAAAEAHLARMVPQSLAAFETASSTEGWGTTPVSYLLATRDEALLPVYQLAMAQGVGATVSEVEGPHIPTLSTPEIVAAHIVTAAVRVEDLRRREH